jgi:hypothetical protein
VSDSTVKWAKCDDMDYLAAITDVPIVVVKLKKIQRFWFQTFIPILLVFLIVILNLACLPVAAESHVTKCINLVSPTTTSTCSPQLSPSLQDTIREITSSGKHLILSLFRDY